MFCLYLVLIIQLYIRIQDVDIILFLILCVPLVFVYHIFSFISKKFLHNISKKYSYLVKIGIFYLVFFVLENYKFMVLFIHEFSHAFTAQALGYEVEYIQFISLTKAFTAIPGLDTSGSSAIIYASGVIGSIAFSLIIFIFIITSKKTPNEVILAYCYFLFNVSMRELNYWNTGMIITDYDSYKFLQCLPGLTIENLFVINYFVSSFIIGVFIIFFGIKILPLFKKYKGMQSLVLSI